MLRKQIYIRKQQQALLRRLAKARGVSEAEIIRQAIDREAGAVSSQPFVPDPAAWEAVLRFVESLPPADASREPYRWRREDAYEERMSRFDRFGPRAAERSDEQGSD
jgi:hypothetical protein